MRFELKKLLFRREAWVLFLAAVLFLGVWLLRIKTPPLAKEYRAELANYAAPYQEIRQRLLADCKEAERLAAEKGEEGLPEGERSPEWRRAVVLRNLVACAADNDRFLEERKQRLEGFLGQLENPPTKYAKRDLQKAYRMYDRQASFYVINQWDVTPVFLMAQDRVYDYLYLIFVLAFFGGLFAWEAETKMEVLLVSSKKGKSVLFWEKLGAAVLLLVPVAFFFTVVPFVGIWIKNGISFRIFAVPLQSVRQLFSESPYAVSIGGFLLAAFVLRLLAGLLALSVLVLCSAFLNKSLSVFFCSAAVCLPLTALGAGGGRASRFSVSLRRLGGFGLLEPCGYFSKYETGNVCGVPVTYLAMAVAATVACCVFLLVLAYGGYLSRSLGGD